MALPAAAASHHGTASISGTIRDSHGVPQMGAMVEVMAPSSVLTIFSDERGRYTASELVPGKYRIKVSAASFLPSLRENLTVRSGASLVVNLTLNTLYEAMQLMPLRGRASADDDDWRWTLRSMANRPLLRVLPDGPLVVVSQSESKKDKVLKARVAFLAGTEGSNFGSAADSATSFDVEKSIFSAGTFSFDGNVGNASRAPTVLRASYTHEFSNGSRPQVAITVRRFAPANSLTPRAALQALAMSLSDRIALADFAEIRYGGEYQTVQYQGRVAALRPFGTVDIHLSPRTVLEYGYSTSQPNTRLSKGFDSAPADLTESGPRLSLVGGAPKLEHGRHQEISLSRRFGNTNLQLAAYSDHVSNAALLGVGASEADDFSGTILNDPYSQTFTYNGGSLNTNGIRAVAQRKFEDWFTATFDYAYGGALDDARGLTQQFETQRRHAIAGKLEGIIPCSKTRWIASYRWTNHKSLTAVDAFNASAGQADPYLNLFLRQPLPFLPGQMEALVDVRNLLAQGYLPIMGRDGETLYLVQSARSVRGGVAFIF